MLAIQTLVIDIPDSPLISTIAALYAVVLAVMVIKWFKRILF